MHFNVAVSPGQLISGLLSATWSIVGLFIVLLFVWLIVYWSTSTCLETKHGNQPLALILWVYMHYIYSLIIINVQSLIVSKIQMIS